MIDYTHVDAETLSEALANLYQILCLLRSPDGCPWDREQQESDMAKALLDETYEYIDALQHGSHEACSEEIGDVLLNAFMILRIHEEHGDFNPVDSLNQVCNKLVRRHPHVFASVVAETSTEVLDIWNTIKEKVEGKTHTGDNAFVRIPKGLPKLEEAWEIQRNMHKKGFDWPDVGGVMEKVEEELMELREAIFSSQTKERIDEELGDLLFAVVNLARYLNISPSIALHKTNRKIMGRFNETMRRCIARGITLDADHAVQMNDIWNEIKREKPLDIK